MLKVAQIKYIKHLRDDEGLSINEIAQKKTEYALSSTRGKARLV